MPGNNSTRAASDWFLSLTDEEIALRVKLLSMDELKRLAPALRILFAGLMAYDEQHSKNH